MSLGLQLSHLFPQAVVLVLFGALLGLSLYGATLVQDGLALTDVVPRGTKEHAFLSTQLRYFSLYEVALVTQGGFDYAHSQRALFDLHQRFSSLKAVLPPPATQAPRTWLHYYRNWLQGELQRRGVPSVEVPYLGMAATQLQSSGRCRSRLLRYGQFFVHRLRKWKIPRKLVSDQQGNGR